uniref:Uncharacterized protein n=1 Tax=Sphenodon punctatus TaxID=8508 RepID=A0A8D0L197_SPHPU
MLMKTDMNSIVDKWLDVSERLDDNTERLRGSVSLWDDVLTIGEDIDVWSNNSISQLNDVISNLSSSQRTEAFLKEFQVPLHISNYLCWILT